MPQGKKKAKRGGTGRHGESLGEKVLLGTGGLSYSFALKSSVG